MVQYLSGIQTLTVADNPDSASRAAIIVEGTRDMNECVV